MTWYGRQMTSCKKDGVTYTMSYDADGLRGSKEVKGVTTTYQYIGDKLFYENRGNGDELYYFYDSYGNLNSIRYINTSTKKDDSDKEIIIITNRTYYAATNFRGDVIALYHENGKMVARYEYDAWGKARIYAVTQDNEANVFEEVEDGEKTGHIAVINPIRYRGYYYDEDLNLYYLQSRYYDAVTGRFINADGYITTGQGVLSYNMFAYCGNNPVNMVDQSGEIPWLIVMGAIFIVSCVVVGGVFGGSADEPLIKKSQDATEKSHRDKMPKKDIYINRNPTDTLKNDSQDIHSTSDAIDTKQELTTKDRVTNVFIGATLGLAVGGATVTLVAMAATPFVGCTVGSQMFAMGALAFNAEAMIFGPFYAIALDPIEWDTKT